MAAQHDLDIYKGADFAIQFQLSDASGVPLDLSSATIASQIKTITGSLLASFSITTQLTGLVTLTLPRATTVNLPADRHEYNVVLRMGGTDEVIVEGSVVVRPQITVIV